MLCRGLVGASFRPLRLELAYPAPAYAQEYEALFECEVRFGMPRNRELIDPAWLSRRLPAWNPVSAQQELALCRAQMPRGPASGESVDRKSVAEGQSGAVSVDLGGRRSSKKKNNYS